MRAARGTDARIVGAMLVALGVFALFEGRRLYHLREALVAGAVVVRREGSRGLHGDGGRDRHPPVACRAALAHGTTSITQRPSPSRVRVGLVPTCPKKAMPTVTNVRGVA